MRKRLWGSETAVIAPHNQPINRSFLSKRRITAFICKDHSEKYFVVEVARFTTFLKNGAEKNYRFSLKGLIILRRSLVAQNSSARIITSRTFTRVVHDRLQGRHNTAKQPSSLLVFFSP